MDYADQPCLYCGQFVQLSAARYIEIVGRLRVQPVCAACQKQERFLRRLKPLFTGAWPQAERPNPEEGAS